MGARCAEAGPGVSACAIDVEGHRRRPPSCLGFRV